MANLGKMFSRLGPVIAVAMAAGLSGCDRANFNFNGEEGVALAELDMSGEAPHALNLLGPDTVVISQGDTLAITVEGSDDIAARLRFILKDGTLSILRHKEGWDLTGSATVNVTMPAPDELVLGGSGSIRSAALASKANVTIGGSGEIEASGVAAERLEVTIAGSGSFTADGSAEKLELNVIGSGDAKMAALKVDKAEISIAGSGDAELASDGEVEVNIVGSGNVTVQGSAKCTMNGVGSGTVKCTAGTTEG